MHIHLINPNTTASITDLVLTAARGVASPGTVLTASTGRFGARYIASRAAAAIAGHAALDCYAEHGQAADVVGIACFGDPGLAGLRELAHQPVVGMAEAACLMATTLGRRFAIVTGGERWGPMLEEFVASLGLSQRLAGVATVAPSGADIARDPDRALAMLADACRRAVDDFGAEAVILGGAGLAGLSGRIARHVPVPLIDSVTALVRVAEARAGLAASKPTVGSHAATPVVETVGLGEALAKRLSG